MNIKQKAAHNFITEEEHEIRAMLSETYFIAGFEFAKKLIEEKFFVNINRYNSQSTIELEELRKLGDEECS